MKHDNEVMQIFYGQMQNKELLINPLDRFAYPEYEKQYNQYKPVNDFKVFIRNLKRYDKKFKNPMNCYISAYDYDARHDIHDFHKQNNNYKHTSFGYKLKPSYERLAYPYEKYVYFDRIFHDFDAELLDMHKDFLKQSDVSLKEKQEYLQEVIEHSNLIRKPLQEAKELGKAYEMIGLKPVYLFSGKGIHLYVFFDAIKLKYPAYMLTNLYKNLQGNPEKEKDNRFKTLDNKVFEPARKSRIVLSVNPKTNLYVKPINPNWTPFEIIDDARSSEVNYDIDLTGNDSRQFHKALQSYDIKRQHEIDKMKARQKLQPFKRSVIQINKNKMQIARPIDAVKLLQYPCFNKMTKNDASMLLLMNVLSFTHLNSAKEIQDAASEFWNAKGIKIDKDSKGLNRIKRSVKKYPYGNNAMKKQGNCIDCQNWQDCWKYNVQFIDEYYEMIEKYKIKQNY